jgi:glycosyltransferase involved in cell wall biosynthesis
VIRVSVIIPTRNRPAALAACLRALSESYCAGAETIVVSDGGDADLAPVVAPYLGPLRLRLIEIPHSGPAAARNHGLRAAQGAIAVFTDDDCRPRAGWLSTLAEGVVLMPPRAVGGATHNGLPADIFADTAHLVLCLLSRHDRKHAGRERLLPSNNFAFPKDALLRLGGFDEQYRTAEDRELCRRWSQAGYELARVPADLDHDERMNAAGFFRKFVSYGRGAADFHGSGERASLRESVAFHLRLPALVLPELLRRPVVRALGIVGLLVVWEFANLAGFLSQRLLRKSHRAEAHITPQAAR